MLWFWNVLRYNFPLIFVGVRKEVFQRGGMKETGCEFCFWVFSMYGPPRRLPNVSTKTCVLKHTLPMIFLHWQLSANDLDISPNAFFYNWDHTCQFDPRSQIKSKKCIREIDRVRAVMTRDTNAAGERVLQYANTPSCDRSKGRDPFYVRYWGKSYPRLLRIKKRWDPQNIFNHCQSLGSEEEHCCHWYKTVNVALLWRDIDM